MGMSIKGISSAFELSRNTVRRYVRMFQDSGCPWMNFCQCPDIMYRNCSVAEEVVSALLRNGRLPLKLFFRTMLRD